jgi:hypothetical protein
MADPLLQVEARCLHYDEARVGDYACIEREAECCGHGTVGCCDIGCCPCLDVDEHGLQVMDMAVSDLGHRWIRPKVGGTNRDARGEISNVASGIPHRVPRFIRYEVAPCWTNFGTEDFEGDACRCHQERWERGTSPTQESWPDCKDGTPVGELLSGEFPSCVAYMGHDWVQGPAAALINCRGDTERGVQDIDLRATPLSLPLFVRLPWAIQDPQQPMCTSNLMVACAGIRPDSDCRLTGDPIGTQYWTTLDELDQPIADGCRQIWNEVQVDTATSPPRLKTNGLFLHKPAVVASKNAVLQAVCERTFPNPEGVGPGVRFDRLDYQASGLSEASNDKLDFWSRSYYWDELPCEELLAAQTFPNSLFLYSRVPANAELVILHARFELSLIPHRVCHKTSPSDECEMQTWPFARIRILAECEVRGRLPNGTCTLSTVSPPPGEHGPIIIYDENGDYFNPPRRAQWWGMLGYFSHPRTENIARHAVSTAAIRETCLALADDMTDPPIVVPAWPYLAESHPEDPNQLYTGSVAISFGIRPSGCGG